MARSSSDGCGCTVVGLSAIALGIALVFFLCAMGGSDNSVSPPVVVTWQKPAAITWTAKNRPSWVRQNLNNDAVEFAERCLREGHFTAVTPDDEPNACRLWFTKARWESLDAKGKKAALTVVSGMMHAAKFSPKIEAWIEGGSFPVASGSYLTEITIYVN